jgi:phenylacetate-coenzyme A ligase PaaK-like adenylate-forming protein
MFYNPGIQDFKAEVTSSENGLDSLRLLIEPRRGRDVAELKQTISDNVRSTFEVTPEITFLEFGTLGKEFESSIKAARFVDKRG